MTTQSRITIATAARTTITGVIEQPTHRLESGPHGRHAHHLDLSRTTAGRW